MLGLKRIALHNSFFNGMTVLFDADGHSNASGGNGAGKTSALNLIPIFYGTEPNQLVDQIADKDSFLDFYLPKQSSALIYEHIREDGPRLVIMYRHSSGSKTVYRFVHGSLEETFFHPTIAPLLEKGSAITDVFLALSEMGVGSTRQIDTITDYRAFIQNDRRLLRRKGGRSSADAALAREYCLGGPNDHMSHLDRMSFAILRRADMFDRLKRMIAETQFNDIHIDDRPEHLKDKTLIEDIAGVRDFGAAEPLIRESIKYHQQRNMVIADRDSALSQLKYRCIEAMEKIEALTRLCKDSETNIKKMNASHQAESQALRQALQQLLSEKDQLIADIDSIHKQHQKWVEWDVAEKQSDYANLDQHLDRMNQLDADLKMLTEKVAHLEGARNSAKFAARENLDKAVSQYKQKQLLLSEDKNKLLQEFSVYKADLEAQKHQEINLLSTGELACERQQINDQMIEAQQQAKSSPISAEHQLMLDNIHQQIEEVSEEIDQQKSIKENTEASQKELEKKYREALEACQQAVEERQRLQQRYDAIHKLVYPADGTLLSELRLLDPSWTERLGKVIDPTLLSRSDLQPDFQQAALSTFYGWSLALEKIDTPDHSVNEASLVVRLEEAESRLRVSKQRCEDRESEAADLYKAFKAFDSQLTEIDYKLRQFEGSLRNLRVSNNETKALAKAEAKRCQAEFADQAEGLKKALEDHDRRMAERRTEIEHSFAELRIEIVTREQTALHEIDSQVEQLNDEITQAETDFKERMKRIEQRFTEKCEHEGVDPEKIRSARREYGRQQEKVKTINGYMTKLQEYDHWLKTYWVSVPKKEHQLVDLKAQCASAEGDIQALIRQYDQRKSQLEKRLEDDQRLLKTLNAQREQAQQLINDCPVIEGVSEPSASLVDLTNQLSRLLKDENQLKKQVLAGVGKAQTILNKYVNSRIFKAWESLLEQRRQLSHADEYSESFRLKQPDDLQHLLDDDLPAIRDILIQQVRAVGDSLSKYHDCLKGLNVEVGRVSRYLGSKINTNQRIENLTNIELQVTSVIIEGDYWDKLSSFNQQWKEWQEGRDLQLPPDSLLLAIQSANESLQSARIGNDINSLIRLRISLEENGRKAHVSNAREFDALSSNGLSYLAILVIFMGMARYLCPNNQIALHWPIDELAALSPENIARLFHMFEESGIYCFSAFPSTDPNLLKFFKHRKLIDRKTGIRNLTEQVIDRPNPLKEKLQTLVLEEA